MKYSLTCPPAYYRPFTEAGTLNFEFGNSHNTNEFPVYPFHFAVSRFLYTLFIYYVDSPFFFNFISGSPR